MFLDDCEIEAAISIEIAGGSDAGPRVSGAYFGRCREVSLAVIPQEDTLPAVAVRNEEVDGTVEAGGGDVGIPIGIEAGESDVARGPSRVAKLPAGGEPSFAIVFLDQFAAGGVVADDDVEVSIGVDIGQGGGIGSIRGRAQLTCGKIPLTVIQQDAIEQRPAPGPARKRGGEAG